MVGAGAETLWIQATGVQAVRSQFNFRDILDRHGIPLTNDTDWAVGHMLAALARQHGIEPDRVLVEKTNPEPSVDAPHCIAHYPMALFDPAMELIGRWWGDRGRQLGLEL